MTSARRMFAFQSRDTEHQAEDVFFLQPALQRFGEQWQAVAHGLMVAVAQEWLAQVMDIGRSVAGTGHDQSNFDEGVEPLRWGESSGHLDNIRSRGEPGGPGGAV